MKTGKYRIVEHKKLNLRTGQYKFKHWTIEQKKRILFFTYWKTLFTASDPWEDHSEFSSLEEAENILKLLTGKLADEITTVVKVV